MRGLFAEALSVYEGISGSESVVDAWSWFDRSWHVLFNMIEIRHELSMLAESILGASFWTRADGPWSKLHREAEASLVEQEPSSCRIQRDDGSIRGLCFSTCQKVSYPSYEKQLGGTRPLFHHVSSAVQMNQCPICESTFSSAHGAKEQLVGADAKTYCLH